MNTLTAYPDGNGGHCFRPVGEALGLWPDDEVKIRGFHPSPTSELTGEMLMSEAIATLDGGKETDPFKTLVNTSFYEETKEARRLEKYLERLQAEISQSDLTRKTQEIRKAVKNPCPPRFQARTVKYNGANCTVITRKQPVKTLEEGKTQPKANEVSEPNGNGIPEYLVAMYDCQVAINGKPMEVTPERHQQMSNKNWRNLLLYRHEVPENQVWV